MMPTDTNATVDSTGFVARPLRAKETTEAYLYYRYRASLPQPVRDLLAARWGLPMGCFDQHETPDHRYQRVAQMGAQLLAMGYPLDASVVGGPTTSDQTPLSLQVVRGNQASSSPNFAPPATSLNPEDYIPWPDMICRVKPFTWNIDPPELYKYGFSDDRDGVGAIYQSNGKERFDVGARYSDGDKMYEKVKQAHFFNSTAVWERIA